MTDTTTAAARPAHTPGPWTVNPIRPVQVATDTDTPQLVATAAADGDPYTAIANARLIAAAPELLAVLQEVDAFISGAPDAVEPFGRVRAAIAKVTGDAS